MSVFRCYVDKNFRRDTLEFIDWINSILAEYAEDGYVLTVRQLHYRLNARDPERYPNTAKSYNKLVSTVSDGRIAGKISWTAIEDRGRNLMGHRTWKDAKSAASGMRETFKHDLWADQPCRPEVWMEKQALEGVIGRICDDLRVDFFATKGYNSQSEQWRAGRRFAGYYQKGQRPIVLHFGDHDPSGIDMTRDNRERLELFCGAPVLVIRLALNMEQIEELNPPSNFAKDTDSRFEGYREQYGSESWELDALDPHYISELISNAVAGFRDEEIWDRSLAAEVADKDKLDMMIERL